MPVPMFECGARLPIHACPAKPHSALGHGHGLHGRFDSIKVPDEEATRLRILNPKSPAVQCSVGCCHIAMLVKKADL